MAVIDVAIEAQSAIKPLKGALYVAISEACLEHGDGVALSSLRARGFRYHHRRGKDTEEGEAVFLCDLAKMVPCYATSIEGATGLVLSPDERELLCVWERGGWNSPGGAVDAGENKIEALARECREEVGVVLDPSFSPVYLGGWQKGKARDGCVNDNFSIFAVRAASKAFKVDAKEIHAAAWLPWRDIHGSWTTAGKPTNDRNLPIALPSLPEGKRLVGKSLLKALDLFKAGKGLKCKLEGSEVKIGV
jgi:8-oxo-dGTP pyrophosphatase MutT (NUDIX family)